MSSADEYQQRMREQRQREEAERFRRDLEDQARRQREEQARQAEAQKKSVSKYLGQIGAMPSPFGAHDQAAYRAGQAETEAWKKMLPGGSKPAESARRPAAKDAGFSGGPTGFNAVAGAGGYVSSGLAYSGRPSRARRKGGSGKIILLLLAGLLLFAFVKLSHQSPSSSNSYSGNARQLAANSLELATGKDAVTTRSPSGEMPATRGVTWINGDPTFKDGTTTVRLAPSLIVIEEGSTSARFYINPQGTGIILVPPPDARSRETYNTQTHQYVNTSPRNGDATGNYPNGPPPTMMTKLVPFAQVAMNAINQIKQTPRGATWDDQYFREILKPYDTNPASNPR